jgi:nucleotide-binding universal stress UspA family protein
MARFHTVVAALDFSDSAGDAIDAALALRGREDGGRLHLLHVVPDPAPALWTDEMPQLDTRAVERSWTDAALRQLATLASARGLDPAQVTTAVSVGAPAAEIVTYAARNGADAIVLGSHGHGLVHRFLLGSVADKVVRQAPCAVLVVPHRTLRSDTRPPVSDGETVG